MSREIGRDWPVPFATRLASDGCVPLFVRGRGSSGAERAQDCACAPCGAHKKRAGGPARKTGPRRSFRTSSARHSTVLAGKAVGAGEAVRAGRLSLPAPWRAVRELYGRPVIAGRAERTGIVGNEPRKRNPAAATGSSRRHESDCRAAGGLAAHRSADHALEIRHRPGTDCESLRGGGAPAATRSAAATGPADRPLPLATGLGQIEGGLSRGRVRAVGRPAIRERRPCPARW